MKSKNMSQTGKEKKCLQRLQRSNLSDKRPKLHQNSLCGFEKNFHLNKNVFIELFHFQELSISVRIMVNSLSVSVIWNLVLIAYEGS